MKNWEEFLEAKRCWNGYEATPGKKPYADGSCRKKSFKEFVEAKEPYKNYDSKKNHPEGGLKPSYAKKLGIHAGVETKREAEKKGGFDKLSDKTAARRKSFCQKNTTRRKKRPTTRTARLTHRCGCGVVAKVLKEKKPG